MMKIYDFFIRLSRLVALYNNTYVKNLPFSSLVFIARPDGRQVPPVLKSIFTFRTWTPIVHLLVGKGYLLVSINEYIFTFSTYIQK